MKRLPGMSILIMVLAASVVMAEFRHPGLLHSSSDLKRMHDEVQAGHEPWLSGYEVFKADEASQRDYHMRGPRKEIGRAPSVNCNRFDRDANASYQLALMWVITGEKAYAEKALKIVNGWSRKLRRVTGRDAVLMAGLGPFKMVNAAEILRYTDTGWAEADIEQCERMFLEAIYPAIKDFALFANGNWEIAAMQTVMAIGVFCDKPAIFERGLRYYLNGGGNGRLTHYVINEAGQCQESGRDQGHTQLGLALLSTCCEIAWNQGLDLFAAEDYRLLKGFEYTAKYNLGEDVPFVETLDRTGKYHHKHISDRGRGHLRAVYELVYNHYVNRAGREAPYTKKAAERVRPEGPGRPGADHPGFGTLLFSRKPEQSDPVSVPAAPGGLLAFGKGTHMDISWVKVVDAQTYTVKRRTDPHEPFVVIAEGLKSPAYCDKDVTAGEVYTYTVCAQNDLGRGPDAWPTRACAGLLEGWDSQDVGAVKVPGDTLFDGKKYTLEGSGVSLFRDVNDQMQFAYRSLKGDGTLIARYVPQVSSQFTQLGLILRDGLKPDAAGVSLLVEPNFKDRSVEAPAWCATLATRKKASKKAEMDATLGLGSPYVIEGRLLGACWLRVKRCGDTLTGSVSENGQTWTEVGRVTVSMPEHLLVGLGACSGLGTVTTTVMFDNVSVRASRPKQCILSPDGQVWVSFSLLSGGVPAYSIDYMAQPNDRGGH